MPAKAAPNPPAIVDNKKKISHFFRPAATSSRIRGRHEIARERREDKSSIYTVYSMRTMFACLGTPPRPQQLRRPISTAESPGDRRGVGQPGVRAFAKGWGGGTAGWTKEGGGERGRRPSLARRWIRLRTRTTVSG